MTDDIVSTPPTVPTLTRKMGVAEFFGFIVMGFLTALFGAFFLLFLLNLLIGCTTPPNTYRGNSAASTAIYPPSGTFAHRAHTAAYDAHRKILRGK